MHNCNSCGSNNGMHSSFCLEAQEGLSNHPASGYHIVDMASDATDFASLDSLLEHISE